MTVEEREEKERMVSRSTKSQIVANHRKPSQTISNGRKRSQMVANRRKRSQMVAKNRKRSRRSQMVANDRKWSQKVANYRRRSQAMANRRKRSQMVAIPIANSRKPSQMIAKCRKRTQTIANGHKRSQMDASRRKRSQMVANGCKWSQTKYSLGLNAYWPGPATLAQHLTDIGSVSACNRRQTSCYSKQIQNICITFVQRRPNVFDALYKCYTCLSWVERSPANTRRWTSTGLMLGLRRRRRVCWVCRQAPKRNNKFRLIHSLYCPQELFNNINHTSHWYYTSISYQSLWLRCWRGDISSFLS